MPNAPSPSNFVDFNTFADIEKETWIPVGSPLLDDFLFKSDVLLSVEIDSAFGLVLVLSASAKTDKFDSIEALLGFSALISTADDWQRLKSLV